MPTTTGIERRNHALIAFTLLTGARDSAIASMKLKHIDLIEGYVRQDAREVKTKFSKTFDTGPRYALAEFHAALHPEVGLSNVQPGIICGVCQSNRSGQPRRICLRINCCCCQKGCTRQKRIAEPAAHLSFSLFLLDLQGKVGGELRGAAGRCHRNDVALRRLSIGAAL